MPKVTVATHDGIFHADEVFALAVLRIFFGKKNDEMEIIRTRDLEKIALAKIAVDVGGEYDKVKNRFDHHQKGMKVGRKNEIPYAAFGLIWKHFGKSITSNEDVWEIIEKKLVMPVDALDNGMEISSPIYEGVHDYTLNTMISAISISFEEGQSETAFEKALEFATLILKGEIKKVEDKIEGERLVTAEIIKQEEPEILILEKYAKWSDAVANYKNIKFVIFPYMNSTNWCIQAARDKLETFGNDRISFPKEWRGLSNSDLDAVTGISGGVFCHSGGYFAVATSKETAIEMAKKTIESVK